MNKELWMRENSTFTMNDGSVVEGFRINFCRFMTDGETLDEVDEDEEFKEIIEGSVLPTRVDSNYDDIDESDIDSEDVETLNPTFYIGDDNGVPI